MHLPSMALHVTGYVIRHIDYITTGSDDSYMYARFIGIECWVVLMLNILNMS